MYMKFALSWLALVWHSKAKSAKKEEERRQNEKKEVKRMKRRQKQIRQIKMTLKHETVKLRPRYWTNAAGRTFRWLKKVIKRKRIYWFGTFPWNKWHEKRESERDRHGVEERKKCRETVQWSESLWYTTYRMCNWICIELKELKKTVFFHFLFCQQLKVAYFFFVIGNNANEQRKYPLWAILAPDFCQEYVKI